MAVLVAVVLAVAAGATGYVIYAHGRVAAARAAAPPVATDDDVAAVAAVPHVVFRSTAQGDQYGRVAMTPLSNPDGPRAVTPISCDRVYATASEALCLAANRGLVTTYTAKLYGTGNWSAQHNLPLSGLPSRARLSRDGSLAATTTFVYGDAYTDPGQFSTRTLVTRADGSLADDIEEFRLMDDGRQITATDRNLWGVTFADDDRFYATAASGHETWLVQGSLSSRTLTTIRQDVECPSLSPDGTRIAFKKHGNLPAGQWRIAVYDLRTGTETLLAEQHSIDDQLEWLDDDHVLYGLPRSGTDAASSDIWTVPADGTGQPTIFVHDAWSPSVVR